MATVVGEPAGPGEQVTSRPPSADGYDASARAALLVFVAFLLVAFPVILFGVGSYHWFLRDDFAFLTGRSATSLDDLFAPHAGHWSTVPVLAFRGLWALFGLRTYVPYEATVIALHLTACALLRVIMRRSGVGPWTATVAASTFVLFGPGQEDIVWAFQIGFTGSLVFGLTQLVLADHEGGPDGRDALGVIAGALALMSSGVGLVMVVVAGIAVLGRRGWRIAALHTVPLAALYAIWRQVEQPSLTDGLFGRPPLDAVWDWVRNAQIGVFVDLGHFELVGALLGAILVVGLVVAWARVPWRELRSRAAMPVAMLAGGILFAVLTAEGRWWAGVTFARSSRYMHIGAALALPALAVAVSALVQRWRAVGVVALGVLAIGIPWNATTFQDTPFNRAYFADRKRILTEVVRLPEAREVPRWVRPIGDPFVGPDLTIGWLLDARDQGKLDPATGPMSQVTRQEMLLRLGVAQSLSRRQRQGVILGPPPGCRTITRPLDLDPPRGTRIRVPTPVQVSLRTGRAASAPLGLMPGVGEVLTVELDGMHLRLAPAPGSPSFLLCPPFPPGLAPEGAAGTVGPPPQTGPGRSAR